ncbi:MAG: TonB-dependent receptor [Gemmatimonadales bacterium]
MQSLANLTTVLTAAILGATTAAAQSEPADTTKKPGSRRTTLDEVTVTATRTSQAIRAVPANIAVITREAQDLSAAQTVPDLLRVLPGFTTRDFQSMIVAHPSRSAAAFRGLGTTSSSRALVLLDGVPVNEGFAGWVHWPRIPLSLVERTEVVRGGGSGIWGSRSLGGVINLVSRDPARSHLDLGLEGGTFGTKRASATGSYRGSKVRFMGAADWYDTDGFVVVRSDLVGPVDTDSYQNSKTVYGRVIYDPTANLQLHFAGSYLDEFINVGTRLKDNNIGVTEFRGGARWLTNDGGVFRLTAYRNTTSFDQYFSAESLDRTTETPSLNQFDVPSSGTGANLQWSKAIARHEVTVGGDWSRVDGTVNEDLAWVQTAFTRRRRVAGEQVDIGGYVQDAVDLGRGWRLLGSARFDRYRNQDATRKETDLRNSAVLIDTAFAGSSESQVSYSVGVRHQASAAFAWRASAYGAFRAPTLNELYKPARESGNVLLEGQSTLRSERLTGAEIGADVNFGPNVVGRFTGFVSKVTDPIIDATIATAGSTGRNIAPCGFVPAGGTCRQRSNAGSLRTAGLETELEVYPHAHWSIWASYTFNPTKVSASGAQASIDGKASRSAPRHAAAAIVSYKNPKIITLSTTARYVGDRFEDDLNSIDVESFFVIDVRAERAVFSKASVYLKVENLFDREYEVNRTASGFARRGAPRFAVGGLRMRW